ncbi:small heat shock protein [Russula ochroleuca]|uniref:Small heat shock protein n=1 Tax=Russula ochroleuca TaxID=152965 RepID=A0A9P5MWC0_9AGAM|nr:small heat shock protein [Russula ochroleuca]
MSLTHYLFNDTFSGIAALDRFFDDAFHPRALRRVQDSDKFRPRMDVHHDKDTNNITVTFELPGLQKEDVSIDVHNNVLTVSGEGNASSERSEGGYVIRERRYGKFAKGLSLPQGVKNEDIKASMANGVLSIAFPRSTPEAEPKKVTIA